MRHPDAIMRDLEKLDNIGLVWHGKLLKVTIEVMER
jgi:hypothetical protein